MTKILVQRRVHLHHKVNAFYARDRLLFYEIVIRKFMRRDYKRNKLDMSSSRRTFVALKFIWIIQDTFNTKLVTKLQ